jgi:manganese efflux pump family protein
MHDLVVRGVIFLSLGVDTLVVAIGLGLGGLGRRRLLQVGLSFAAAEGIMPLAGFVAGKSIAQAVGDAASYIAIVVLLLLGAYTIRDWMQEQEREYRFHSPMQLLVLCLSVSLDELAIGFSLGLFNVPILAAAAYIAAQAFVLTLVGTTIGRLVARAAWERSELLSGLVLTALAIFLLAEKLLGRG